MDHSINMGTYTISGVSIKLILKIEIKGNSVDIMIPLPTNYPTTKVKMTKVLNEGLFTASLSIISEENPGWLDFLTNTRNVFHLPHGDGIALHSFYVIPRLYNIMTTTEENIMLSGLGKRAICAAFPYIINKLNINPYNTVILLEASGGIISTPGDQERINRYLLMGKRDLLNLYQINYPGAYAEDYEDLINYSPLEIARTLVEIENNKNLVTYYTNTYGLIPLSHESNHTLMGTILSSFMGYCQH